MLVWDNNTKNTEELQLETMLCIARFIVEIQLGIQYLSIRYKF